MRLGGRAPAAALAFAVVAALLAGGWAGPFAPVGAPSAAVDHTKGRPSAPLGSPAGSAGSRLSPADGRLVGGGQGRLLVTSSDPAVVPNDGLRVNVTAFATEQLPPNSAFQVGGEETIGPFEAVFGIFQNTGSVPTAFFSVFTNLTDRNVHLAYWVGLALVGGDAYDFALVHANGTNWSLTVNGHYFGGSAANATYEFNASAATWAGGLGFSEVALYDTTPSVPALVVVPLALAVHRAGGGWYLPVSGATSFAGSGGPQWGVQGRLQHPSLAPGELETGSQIANQTNGTALWNSGPVPVHVAVNFPASPVVATTPALVVASVTSATGAPIPGVTLYLRDSLNGSFPVPSVMTNSSGGAVGLLYTPNVSAAGPDRINATVTLFGYVGGAIGVLALTPPAQVLLSVSPSSPSVSPGGQITLTFTSSNASGVTEPNVLLTFSGPGGSTVTPTFGTTDTNGRVSVVLVAPSSDGDVRVAAIVQNVGQWGRLVVLVHVAPMLGGIELPPTPELVAIGVLAGTVALIAFAVLRYRRGRKQLPDMPLRRYLRETRPPPPPPTQGPGVQP